MNLWSLVLEGGYVMIPLGLLFLLAVYVFIERCIAFHKAGRIDPTFMKRIRDYVLEGDLENAVQLCKRTDSPYSRLILKGVNRIGRPMNDVLVAIENTGNIEVGKLEKGFTLLSTTAAGAPMIGFLGTVMGMIDAFYSMASAGSAADVTVLSSGIYEALVTTVAGLIVGIVALFAYNYLVARVNRIMNEMEARTMEFMDLLNEPS
ncbi:MAG: MotA/TolQ/ExbB proton channel family protein [Muribaculaceae bacterium]|nr:MotA/TolQ/ExbB proton channel family protein [Muribaculaceae bacterium]